MEKSYFEFMLELEEATDDKNVDEYMVKEEEAE